MSISKTLKSENLDSLNNLLINSKKSKHVKILKYSIKYSSLDTIKYILENTNIKFSDLMKIPYEFYRNSRENICDIVMLFIKHYDLNNCEYWVDTLFNFMIFACENDNVELLKILLKFDDSDDIVDDLFRLSTSCDSYNCKNYLVTNYNFSDDNTYDYYDLVQRIKKEYEVGNLDGVKILLGKINENDLGEIFADVCYYGHYDIAKLLLKKYPKININYNEGDALIRACEQDHLEIIKLLLQQSAIDVHILDECAIRILCEHGQLDIVKYMLKKFPDINIHHNNESILYSACIGGHIKVVNFLLENYDNFAIYVRHERIFRHVCRAGNYQVAKLLKKYFPDINHHISNDYCYKKTKNVQLLEWLRNECSFQIVKSARKV